MSTEASQTEETDLSVPTIDCQACATSIKQALRRIEAVQEVQVDIPEKRVRVRYQAAQLSEQLLRDVLERNGFVVEQREVGA